MVLLKQRALTEALAQANTGGVYSTLLLNSEGSLLAHATIKDDEAVLTSAIAANVWQSVDHAIRSQQSAHERSVMSDLILDCEHGKVLVVLVSTFLLCAFADKQTPLGMMKAKLVALRESLKEPLLQIVS